MGYVLTMQIVSDYCCYIYRYKDDVYDRIWEPFKFNNFNNLNSSFSLDSLVQNGYIYIPPIVMSTAVTSVNFESSIDMNWE
jgi:hypothetical protein